MGNSAGWWFSRCPVANQEMGLVSREPKSEPPSPVMSSLGNKAQPTLSRKVLLAVFDADDARAEEKCLELYQRLVRYFEWSRRPDPEDLSQEALRRGFSRLQQGQKITTDDPAGYFFGIARNLIREGWRTPCEETLVDEDLRPPAGLFQNLNQSEQLVFLKECLGGLEEGDFEVLMAYVEGKSEAWIRKTRLTASTLRSRVYRIRQRLEKLAMLKRS